MMPTNSPLCTSSDAPEFASSLHGSATVPSLRCDVIVRQGNDVF